jgi:hypothetical protein
MIFLRNFLLTGRERLSCLNPSLQPTCPGFSCFTRNNEGHMEASDIGEKENNRKMVFNLDSSCPSFASIVLVTLVT